MAKKKNEVEETTDNAASVDVPEKKSSVKFAVIGVVLLGGALFAGMQLGGGGSSEPSTTEVVFSTTTVVEIDPLKATAVPLEPVVVNLADGSYLKVGMTVTVHEDTAAGGGHSAEGGVDLDAMKPRLEILRDEAVSFLSGREKTEVLDSTFREEFRQHLMERAELTFEHSVTAIAIGDWVVS